MAASPLISAAELAARLRRGPAPRMLDVRWRLGAPSQIDEYRRGHLPGAVFVDLDTALAGPPGGGRGRHPLPAARDFEAAMRRAGVFDGRPVVIYDAAGPAIAAARAWWLLRYFGHTDARVLDGGLEAAIAAGIPLSDAEVLPDEGDFTARPGSMPVVDAAGASRLAREGVLLDVRTGERYRGENEPIDPVAGHIPGARNAPETETVDAAGRLLPAPRLRDLFAAHGAGSGAAVGAYCGSGVTAAHAVLALEVAGINAALYGGSWSEWVADPQRPVATGAEPG